MTSSQAEGDAMGIAVIGMSGRFPGARDLSAFWRNLCDGVESLVSFSDEELLADGEDPAVLGQPHYVKVGGPLAGVDEFDATFFGYSPREAAILDPQQRLFLEAAWTALDDAGHGGARPKAVGVFAGQGLNTYLLNNVCANQSPGRAVEELTTLLGSDKDFLATRVSFHLDLTGPSFTVQSGCSTSLLAIAQAVSALESLQCDMALAGGVSIRAPQRRGYRYVPEGILSPDGHCRPFDAEAGGTVFGSGLGVVVLKRLAEALADGDNIRAVIRGAAVNNDGSDKLGFTAPSVDRQAAVIAQALAVAGVDPDTVGYIEAHGTATALGDPVEVAALSQAFRTASERRGFCALGSVKGNIGHLDAASGVAGLIKTVLALEHGQIPENLHSSAPNPSIDFASSPFFLNTELRPWPRSGTPRRAGVSSFGVGGTNVHVVLEEAPGLQSTAASEPWQLLLLSARTAAALAASGQALAEHLDRSPTVELADVAHTLRVGRQAFDLRRACLCRDRADAVAQLRALAAEPCGPESSLANHGLPSPPLALSIHSPADVVPGAWAGLHEAEPVFAEQLDRCCELLAPHFDDDLRGLLIDGAASQHLIPVPPRLAEPAGFVVAYALARLLMDWGLRPEVIVCSGVGELVAASLTQVFRLETALGLAALRGRWLHASSAEQRQELGAAFLDLAARAPRKPPEFPFASLLTGEWITPAKAREPSYWLGQLESSPVAHDSAGLGEMCGDRLLIELGQGGSPESRAIPFHPAGDGESARRGLLETVAKLWQRGVAIDWSSFTVGASRRRVSLPSYPFAREQHWLAGAPFGSGAAPALAPLRDGAAQWLSLPSWRRVHPLPSATSEAMGAVRWLLLAYPGQRVGRLASRLIEGGAELTVVRPGAGFAQGSDGSITVDPANGDDFRRLVAALDVDGQPVRVAHLWLASADELSAQAALEQGYVALHHLTSALGAQASHVHVTVVTCGVHDVVGDEMRPDRSTVIGACRVLPQERARLQVRQIDGEPMDTELAEPLLSQLAAELCRPGHEPLVACRGGHRWLPGFDVMTDSADTPSDQLAMDRLRQQGVYLITGGLGGLGLTLARFLAETCGARLVLVGRTGLPPREQWVAQKRDPSSDARQAILAVEELESLGAEVLVLAADVADRAAMASVISAAHERFGTVHGVIHGAGVPGRGLSADAADEPPTAALRAKWLGTKVLVELCADEVEFIVLCSALSTVLGGIGQADYAAANAFMDALATARSGRPGARMLSIAWDTWADVGMAAKAKLPQALRGRQAQVLAAGLSCAEGVEVFQRALASDHCYVLVSKFPLQQRLSASHGGDLEPSVVRSQQVSPDREPAPARELRPATPPETPAPESSLAAELSRDGELPQDDVTSVVASAWRQLLGLEQAELDDSFFEQGGNSLLATQLLARLARDYPDAGLSLRGLFEQPTLGGLVTTILASQGGDSETDELSLAERVLASRGADRRGLLHTYLSEQLQLEHTGDLAELDQTLVAGQLTSVLHSELGLSIYPSEVRRRPSLSGLVDLVAGELERLEQLAHGEVAPASAVDPASFSRPERALPRRVPDVRNPSMVFLLSAPRSGSTLLRLMLSAHSELFCPPELFLLDNEGMASWQGDPFHGFYGEGLVRALMARRDLPAEKANKLVDALVARDAPVYEVYRLLQEGPGLLVDKTPTYALSRSTLQRAEDLFERPRYIGLVRHPYSVIESMVRNRLDRIRQVEGNSYALAERYWIEACRNTLTLSDDVGPDRFQLVRYEELVREPAAVLGKLCSYLGLRFDEAVLDPYGKGSMFGGPGDPHLFARGAVDPSLADAWRQITLPRPLGEDATELAQQLGFELPR